MGAGGTKVKASSVLVFSVYCTQTVDYRPRMETSHHHSTDRSVLVYTHVSQNSECVRAPFAVYRTLIDTESMSQGRVDQIGVARSSRPQTCSSSPPDSVTGIRR